MKYLETKTFLVNQLFVCICKKCKIWYLLPCKMLKCGRKSVLKSLFLMKDILLYRFLRKKNSRTKQRATCAEKSAENCVLEQRRISRNHTESAVLLLKVTRSSNTRWRPARKMNSVNYKLMFLPFNLSLTLG